MVFQIGFRVDFFTRSYTLNFCELRKIIGLWGVIKPAIVFFPNLSVIKTSLPIDNENIWSEIVIQLIMDFRKNFATTLSGIINMSDEIPVAFSLHIVYLFLMVDIRSVSRDILQSLAADYFCDFEKCLQKKI